MDFEHSQRAVELQRRLSAFMDRYVYPVETLYQEQAENGHRYHRPPILEELKRRARRGTLEPVFVRVDVAIHEGLKAMLQFEDLLALLIKHINLHSWAKDLGFGRA